MTHRLAAAAVLLLLSVLFSGCPKPAETVKTELPPPPGPEKKPADPDIVLTVASINLASVPRRIEKGDVDGLCSAVLREKADVLAVQGITRYPGVATRIDVFQAIASGTGMRSVFGETIELSGRQAGNALYSTYPINSHENTPYAGAASANFESALVSIIDAGAREIAVVSTLLPERTAASDRNADQQALNALRKTYAGTPLIVAGNLPKLIVPPMGLPAYAVEQPADAPSMRLWYTPEGLRPIRSKVVESALGAILVTQFGVFRKPQQ